VHNSFFTDQHTNTCYRHTSQVNALSTQTAPAHTRSGSVSGRQNSLKKQDNKKPPLCNLLQLVLQHCNTNAHCHDATCQRPGTYTRLQLELAVKSGLSPDSCPTVTSGEVRQYLTAPSEEKEKRNRLLAARCTLWTLIT